MRKNVIISKYEIEVEGIKIIVYKKRIKHLYLKVFPSDNIKVSAPYRLSKRDINKFILSKIDWIKKHRESVKEEIKKEYKYISGEVHYFKGKEYILKIVVLNIKEPKIIVEGKYIYYYIPYGYSQRKKEDYYLLWLKKKLKEELDLLIPEWESKIGVNAKEIRIRKMKTRWGTCNPFDKRIWINLELIKRDKKFLEYIVVHELLHLIEKRHNKRFYALMDKFLPDWKNRKEKKGE